MSNRKRTGEKETNFFRFRDFQRPFSKLRLALVFGSLLFAACQPNAEITNSGGGASASPAANSGKGFDSLDKDLEVMRTADFDFIYVFRRKDGAALTSEERKFLKSNSPASTNRFLLSDDDKAVIAGSKFKFSPENMAALKSYFSVEDHSKPESQIKPGANANAASQSNL